MTADGVEPVELLLHRHHPYAKTKRGCATCGERMYHPCHLGATDSFNAMGSGSQWTYQAMKKGWQEALALALDASGLPRGLARVVAEGRMCFPEHRARDQGNHRFILEKALGDALQHGFEDIAGGWLANDRWDSYEFGNLEQVVQPGESWTRVLLMPTAGAA